MEACHKFTTNFYMVPRLASRGVSRHGARKLSHGLGFYIIGAAQFACYGKPALSLACALADICFAISGCDSHEFQPSRFALLLFCLL